MDDFDQTYAERQRQFEAGLKKGIQQAQSYDLQDLTKQGQQFGKQFGKELAMYESFLIAFSKIKNSKNIKYSKVESILQEMEDIKGSIDYKSLQVVKNQRQVLQKKFELFLAMTNIKKVIQSEIFSLSKSEKKAIDF